MGNLDIMASFRTPALRHVVSGAAPYLRATQRRWAQVHDVRFLATQQSDRIIEKYKEKLAKKAQEEGLRDINELKEVYKDKIQHLKKKAYTHPPRSSARCANNNHTIFTLSPSSSTSTSTNPADTALFARHQNPLFISRPREDSCPSSERTRGDMAFTARQRSSIAMR